MRAKAILLKVVTLCVAMGLFIPTGSMKLSASTDPDSIPIIPYPNVPAGAPKAPVYNPFFAYVDGNSVWLGCSSSYGDISVKLVSTAGDSYQCVFDTDDGMIQIPVSGCAGHYTLILYPSGDYYYVGEFDL